MKVLFDIAVLGHGHSEPLHRAGLFRAVENIALGLAASPDCELSFVSSRQMNQALDYLEASPHFSGVALPHSPLRRRIYEEFRALGTQPTPGSEASKLRRCLYWRTRYVKDLVVRGLSAIERRSRSSAAAGLVGAIAGGIDAASLQASEIYHSPFDALPASVRQATHLRKFLTVHDLIPVLFPHFCGRGFPEFFRTILDSIEPDCWVLCDSQATKDDLCDYKNVDPARVAVVYLAADPVMFRPCGDPALTRPVREKYGIPDQPYILSLSTLEPRKNMDHVIRCFAQLVQERGARDLNLVLVGSKGWDHSQIFKTLSFHEALKDRIIVTGRVGDQDLAPLYSGALAFVYPSLYEGFGLPALEAMQCGTPVITSNTSSLPEVVGDAGITVNPRDEDALCQSILHIYKRPSLRDGLSRRSLQRAQQFSWDRCIAETLEAYRLAASGAADLGPDSGQSTVSRVVRMAQEV